MMFSLLKSSFNNIWKGETTKRREPDEISEEGFILVPNRKRSFAPNASTTGSNYEPRIKKDSECNSLVNETPQDVLLDSPDTKNIEVEMAPCLSNTFGEDFSDAALEGIPFIPSPGFIHVYELLKDQPPLCPNLPQVTFDFTLERTVLGR